MQFLLNANLVETDAPDGELVLDWLRRRRRLVGTKEGCKEGDCGACVVMVGERDEGGRVGYLPMTSCLMPLAELHGKHLVTIEGLDAGGSPTGPPLLNPVQAAICGQGGSQCGFCTPGIVVSLSTLLTRDDACFDRASVGLALSGHLCRCTGYRSLKEAGAECAARVPERSLAERVAAGHLPSFFLDAPALLATLPAREAREPEEGAVPIAGGTDLYVQREDLAARPVAILRERASWRGIEIRQDDGGRSWLRVGAATTFQEVAESALLRELIPRLPAAMDEIASWQIRNRATVAGNLVNASPIGDFTALMLALGASLVLARGSALRELPLRDFYLGYKKLAKESDELVVELRLPRPAGRVCHFEKVAKRRSLDIATVNAALALDFAAGGELAGGGLALGGVAPVPLYLPRASALLAGDPSPELWAALIETAQDEVAPISDVRGSADYKRLLVRQLLIALGSEFFPERLPPALFYPQPAAQGEVAHG